MIPNEAVEAAAKAIHELWMNEQFPWEMTTEDQREDYRKEVRAVLGVVLPGRHPLGDSSAGAGE